MKKILALISAITTIVSCTTSTLPEYDQVIKTIDLVNSNWQNSHPEHGRAFWDNAAYHTGNMEV